MRAARVEFHALWLATAVLLLPACAEDKPPTKPDPPATPTATASQATTTTPSASSSPDTVAEAVTDPTASVTVAPDDSVAPPPSNTGAAPPPSATETVALDEPPPPPTGPTAGKPWTLSASAAPDAGYKCNDLYPHKFTPSGSTNATVAGKPRGTCAGKSVAVSIPFTPTSAGAGTVAGTLKYGICATDGTNCVLRSKAISLAFNAAAP